MYFIYQLIIQHYLMYLQRVDLSTKFYLLSDPHNPTYNYFRIEVLMVVNFIQSII